MKTILFITHYAGRGGANTSLTLLITQLKQHGYRIIVLMPTKGYLYEKLSPEFKCIVCRYHPWVEIKKHRTLWIRRILKIFINMLSAMRVAFLLRKHQIDIVHTNDSITIIGAYLAKLLKAKHIWHIREIYDLHYQYQHTFSEKYCELQLQQADTVVAISKAVYKRYSEYKNLKLKLVYDGINHKLIEKNMKGCVDNTFLFCGGTSIGKGFDDVLEIARYLVEQNVEFEILVAGNATDKELYQEKMCRDNTEGRIHFLGFVENMNEIRNKCSTLLMCSKAEAFGLVTVEAMLARMLVIGKNTGATPEIIEHGKSGFIYDDCEQVCGFIVDASTEHKNEIICNAYNRAIENFSIDSTVNDFEQIYNQSLPIKE